MSTPDSQDARPTREQRLAALAEEHHQWSLRHEGDLIEGEPSGEGDGSGDDAMTAYHPAVSPDPNAEAEFMDAAQRILNGEG